MADKQGQLDALCGVYAIVNAVSHVGKLPLSARKHLFKKLLKVLQHQSMLISAIMKGTEAEDIQRMLSEAIQVMQTKYGMSFCMTRVFPFDEAISDENYWDGLRQSLQVEPSALIIGMQGKFDHWTCVIGVSDDHCTLMDSGGMRGLKHHNCRIGTERQTSFYCLDPTHVWSVRLNR
jgi:hypothetical protein